MNFYDFIIHLPNKVFFPFSKDDQIYDHFQKTCCEHVDQNLDALKEFGHRSFPTAHSVKTIYCVETEKFIDSDEV